MKIGITYDLRSDYLKMGYSEEETAEFDKEDTILIIEKTLKDLGHEACRIGNIFKLVQALAQKKSWDLVFNIAEGLHGFGREAQVPSLLESYTIPYTFSDSLTLSVTLHKEMTKRLVRSFGIPTPDFRIISNNSDIWKVDLKGQLFAKPVAEGTAKGISSKSRIKNPEQLHYVCRSLLRRFEQPVLVEEYLPGREFTVGIIGTGKDAQPVGTLEIISKNEAEKSAYTFYNKENCEEVIDYVLAKGKNAQKAEEMALIAWQSLGCRDAGRIDLRENGKGELQFLEVNALPGLHPTHSDLPILCSKVGIDFHELIHRIVESAGNRNKTNDTFFKEETTPSEIL